jgi:hypothetical protein
VAGTGEFAEQVRIASLRSVRQKSDGRLTAPAGRAGQGRLDAERRPPVDSDHPDPSPSDSPGLGAVPLSARALGPDAVPPAVEPPLPAPPRSTDSSRPVPGSAAHALRRVVDPAGNHRTHSRRVGPDPAAGRTPPPVAGGTARPNQHRKPRRTARILGWSLLVAGAVILLGSAWAGWRTYDAYTHLQAASADVTRLQDQLTDITAADPNTTAGVVADMQAEAAAAKSAVNDPVVRAAAVLPFIGPNLDAIREVTLTVDSLATDVMPSLVEIAKSLQPSELAPKDGAIDLEPIEAISPLLQAADVSVNEARQRLAAIDQTALVQPVGDAVSTLTGKLDDAAAVTGPGARTARLLPPMLGSAGQRTYLVLFQNPAEARATGGIFGSYALVNANNGKVTIVDQGSGSRDLGAFDPPIGELSGNERALYGEAMNIYPQDVNFTPDFPTAAGLFAQMYQVRTGASVDGVVAIDPVALSYMLEGSPGVDIGGGLTMTSDNLVRTLLSEAYQQFDGVNQSERDDFLNNATNKVFEYVMGGQAEPRAIIDGLRKASDERRILIFSADGAEQGDIAKTGLAGSMTADSAQPTVGVFMNDGTPGKLDYYLHNEVHITEGECRSDGRRELKVRVVMNYQAPTEGLPFYVTSAEPGQPYLLRTNLLAFAPLGGGVISAERDGVPLGIARGEDHSREVAATTVELLPQTSTEVVFTVVGPAGEIGGPNDVPPRLILTPGVNPWVTSVADYQACATPES